MGVTGVILWMGSNLAPAAVVACQAVMIRQQDGLAILAELQQGSTVEMSFSTLQVCQCARSTPLGRSVRLDFSGTLDLFQARFYCSATLILAPSTSVDYYTCDTSPFSGYTWFSVVVNVVSSLQAPVSRWTRRAG